jgi:glucosamine--fructose-6-phosphate aminotransferase (isomerizing)
MTWSWVISQLIIKSKYIDLKYKVAKTEQVLTAWLADPKTTKNLRRLARKLQHHQHQFILGRGELYFPALEGALKIKEISYHHAEGFSGGELKHGVLALIEKGTPVFCLVQNDINRSGQLNAAAEVRARGGMIIGISPENNQLFDEWVSVPDLPSCRAISQIVPFQLLTCYLAELEFLNPDKPRNLAKSVTVK